MSAESLLDPMTRKRLTADGIRGNHLSEIDMMPRPLFHTGIEFLQHRRYHG